MKYKEKYINYYGEIPKGYEIHHITPKFDEGTDDIENLVALSKEDHKKAHLERYEKYNNFRDLCSYYMIGYNFSEAHQISSSEGGKIGGKKVYENKIGIFRSEEERKVWASMGGKIGAKVQIENKIGIHTEDQEKRIKWASMGGKASSVFKDPKRQSEFGKRGGIKNKGSKWYTDSKGNHKKFKPTINETFEQFLEKTKFQRGRK